MSVVQVFCSLLFLLRFLFFVRLAESKESSQLYLEVWFSASRIYFRVDLAKSTKKCFPRSKHVDTQNL